MLPTSQLSQFISLSQFILRVHFELKVQNWIAHTFTVQYEFHVQFQKQTLGFHHTPSPHAVGLACTAVRLCDHGGCWRSQQLQVEERRCMAHQREETPIGHGRSVGGGWELQIFEAAVNHPNGQSGSWWKGEGWKEVWEGWEKGGGWGRWEKGGGWGRWEEGGGWRGDGQDGGDPRGGAAGRRHHCSTPCRAGCGARAGRACQMAGVSRRGGLGPGLGPNHGDREGRRWQRQRQWWRMGPRQRQWLQRPWPWPQGQAWQGQGQERPWRIQWVEGWQPAPLVPPEMAPGAIAARDVRCLWHRRCQRHRCQRHRQRKIRCMGRRILYRRIQRYIWPVLPVTWLLQLGSGCNHGEPSQILISQLDQVTSFESLSFWALYLITWCNPPISLKHISSLYKFRGKDVERSVVKIFISHWPELHNCKSSEPVYPWNICEPFSCLALHEKRAFSVALPWISGIIKDARGAVAEGNNLSSATKSARLTAKPSSHGTWRSAPCRAWHQLPSQPSSSSRSRRLRAVLQAAKAKGIWCFYKWSKLVPNATRWWICISTFLFKCRWQHEQNIKLCHINIFDTSIYTYIPKSLYHVRHMKVHCKPFKKCQSRTTPFATNPSSPARTSRSMDPLPYSKYGQLSRSWKTDTSHGHVPAKEFQKVQSWIGWWGHDSIYSWKSCLPVWHLIQCLGFPLGASPVSSKTSLLSVHATLRIATNVMVMFVVASKLAPSWMDLVIEVVTSLGTHHCSCLGMNVEDNVMKEYLVK